MFTDTKNLANLTANVTNAVAKQNNSNTHTSEDKFKLKKMWKPIIRLMSRKSALTRNGTKRDHNSCIPNNVHLNNASQYQAANTNKDLLASTPTATPSPPPHLIEDPSDLTHKLPLAADFLQRQQQLNESKQMTSRTTETLEFISKVSIDKTPLNTCTNCVYGRNCQHTQFHPTTEINSLQPLNYFDAEDGCFVWSDGNGAEIDENALREWLWQNSWQFAENATMC